MAEYTFTSEPARIFIGKVLAALDGKRSRTREELQAELFASKTKMLAYLRFLSGGYGQIKRIYICGYRILDCGLRVSVYALGNKPDAVPPPALTAVQRWKRLKADPLRHEQRCRNLRTKAATRRAVKRPQHPFSALGL